MFTALLVWGLIGAAAGLQTALGVGLPASTPLPALQGDLQAPARVAADSQSRVYVSDPLAGQVVVFDAFGRKVQSQAVPGKPLGIAVDGAGSIYLGDAETGAVNVFDWQWNLVGQLGQGAGEFQLPGHIAVASNGGVTTVFVSDSLAHNVKAYRDGLRVGQYGSFGMGPNQFDFPAGLWVSPDGLLCVVDQNNDRVQVLDFNGTFLRWFDLQPSITDFMSSGRAQGLTGDAQGRLFVADTFQGYVKVFETSGSFLGYLGGYGESLGQLRSPGGLTLDPLGRLWVASANNARVDGFGLDCFARFTISPAVQSVAAGSTVTFTATSGCPANGTNQWVKDNNPLMDGGTVSGATNSTLVLSGVAAGDSGNYSVWVNGLAGVLSSPAAWLEVVSAPSIVSGPGSRTMPQGGTVVFGVNAQGAGLKYQWMQDGIALVGAQQSTLVLTNIQPWAAGSYSVVVSNAAGAVTSGTATLTVVVPPVITEPPLDRIAAAGSTVGFSVTAAGSAPLTYQWFRNGVVLSGQTKSQLSLTSVTSAMNGVYLVRVQNTAGYATASVRFAVDGAASVLATPTLDAGVSFTWNNPYYVLQAAPGLEGPWQVVSTNSPYTVSSNGVAATPGQYFRLLRQ